MNFSLIKSELSSLQLKSARWGAKIVSELADYLKRMNPKRRGFGKRHLYNMVKFYDTYSTEEFNRLGKQLHLDEFVQLPIAQTGMNEIAQSLPAQLPLNEIVQSSIAQIDMPFVNMPKILVLNTFTCHIEILNRCKSYDERVFYMLLLHAKGLIRLLWAEAVSPTDSVIKIKIKCFIVFCSILRHKVTIK